MNGFWKRKLPAFVLAFVLVAGLIPAAGAVEAHEHVWSDLKSNGVEHWRECAVEGCDEKQDAGTHTPGEWGEVDSKLHGKKCTVCEYMTETDDHKLTLIEGLSKPASCYEAGVEVFTCICGYYEEHPLAATKKHTYASAWTSNATHHWHPCNTEGCPDKSSGYEKHSYDTGVYTSSSTQHWQICKVCNTASAKASHVDENKDGRCDICTYGMGTIPAPSGITVTFKNGSANFNAQSNIAAGGRPADPGKPSYPSPAANCTYTFKGWTTANPGAKAIYTGQSLTAATAAVNASTTYYAVYSVSAKSQNVSVNAGKSASVVGGSILTQINNKFSSLTGGNLTSVTFSSPAASSYGTLYANRNRKALGSIAYTYSGGSYPVSNLYFIPGRTSGYTVRYTAKDAYSTVAGTLSLPTAGTSVPDTADIVYQVAPGGTVNFKSSKFQDAYKKLSGGDTDIRYVTFHPDGDYDSFGGALYVGGRAIKGNQLEEKTFYTSNRRYGDHDLNTVSFRASKNAKVGAELVMEFYVHYDEDLYYEGTLRIVISKDDENGDVIYRVAPGGTVDFDRADFNRAYQEAADSNRTIDYVEFEPGDDYTSFPGKISAGSSSGFTLRELTREKFYYSRSDGNDYALNDIVFRATSSARDGDVLEIPFWAYDSKDDYVEGILKIIVDKDGGEDTVACNVAPGGTVRLDKTAFNDVYRALSGRNNRTIRAVSFEAPESYEDFSGSLYVKKDDLRLEDLTHDETWFYYSDKDYGDYALDDVTFQADRKAKEGARLDIPFRAYYEDMDDYEEGILRIKVTSTANTITYEAAPGGSVNFSVEDFNKAYQSMSGTSRTIRYVAFDAGSDYSNFAGGIYTGATPLTRNQLTYTQTQFYYSGASYGAYALSSLSFRANSSARDTASLSIPFRAYYDNNDYEEGTLKLVVDASSAGDIAYTVSPGRTVNFDRVKFDDFFRETYSGYRLDYVVFDVPSASEFPDTRGTLYTGYNTSYSSSLSRSALEDVRFYYDERDADRGDYALNDLTFAAASSFTSGKVTLRFVAYGTNDREVEGTLVISPSTASSSSNYVGSVRYAVTTGSNIQINAYDLAQFYKSIYPAGALQYVTLDGVPAVGSLYYNYYSASRYGTSVREQITAVNRSRSFYMSPSSPSEYALTELTYVPAGSNYCTTIPFTAYGTGGQSVSGSILISVTGKAVSEVYGPTPKNTAVTFPASSIYAAVTAATGSAPSGIQLLKLPAANVGTIYVGSGTATPANTTTIYGYNTGSQQMGQLRFVPKTNYTGSVDIPYVAVNANGTAIASGMFSLGVLNSNKRFNDINASTWCYKYVTELADASVIGGYANGNFKPDNTVTYGAALKLIMLAAGYPEQAPTVKGSTFSGYLSKAQADGLVTRSNVNLNGPITRLQVAQLAAGALKLDINNLSSVKPFSDTADVYVQALNAAGIVGGYFSNGTSTFRPSNTLTRGQISAIVWRMQNYRK